MAAMMRRSVTSLVRTWPSTIIRRAVAKSIIGGFREKWTASLSCNGRAKARRRAARSPRRHTRGLRRLPARRRSCIAVATKRGTGVVRHPAIAASQGPRGGVVTQRSAKPCTPVQFRAWPPLYKSISCTDPIAESFRAAELEGHGNLQEISSSAPGLAADFPLRRPCEHHRKTIHDNDRSGPHLVGCDACRRVGPRFEPRSEREGQVRA